MIFKNKNLKYIEIIYKQPYDIITVNEYSSIDPEVLVRTIKYQKSN